MPKRLVSLPLSTLAGGVNRYDAQASENQTVDALDVIEDDGYLRRRDAFRSVGLGPVFHLPAGRTVCSWNANLYYDRAFSIAATSISGAFAIHVGADVPFDGIDWRNVTPPSSITAHRTLVVSYWNGSSWSVLDAPFDTTTERFVNGSDLWIHALYKNGKISWHRSLMSDWATTSVNGVSKYWVRLYFSGNGVGTGNLVLAAPGPRAFLTAPVTSILPARFTNGLQCVLLGADRTTPRAKELGANVGIWKGRFAETDAALALDDEGAGVIGQISWPAIYRNPCSTGTASAQSWPGGAGWALLAAASGTYGSATDSVLTKSDATYTWITNQHRGSVLYSDLAPTGSITNNSTTQAGGFTFGTISGLAANAWEGCRLVITNTGGVGGLTVGDEREITGNGTTSLTFHDHFAATPTTSTIFDIVKPPTRVRFRKSTRDYETASNTTGTLTLQVARPYTSGQPSADIDRFVHWEVGREFPWKFDGSAFWSSAYDPVTRKMVLTNGKSGLLSFDGVSVRTLTALSDSTSARLQQWIGSLPDTAREALNARALAGSTVRKSPPAAQYITDFHGRLVCVDGIYVRWSAPAPDNDIWPLLYETQIRDSENLPATGCATLGDSLVVWTPTSIHSSPPADDNGMLSFKPIAQGIGFVSARSVCKIAIGGSSFLIGASADGVYTYNGSEPTPVLDEWRKLLPNGVNGRALKKCVAAISKYRTEYYLGVPSAGTDVLDRILVYNWVTRKWFVYSAPWGGLSGLGTDLDEFGKEQVLFGFRDGHVAVLAKRNTDEGQTVTGYARSPTIVPLSSTTSAPVALLVTAEETGATETLTVKSFLNKRNNEVQEHTAVYNDGGAITTTNILDTTALSEDTWVTRRINLPAGTRCESFQFEISGTMQWKFKSAEFLATPKGQRSSR